MHIEVSAKAGINIKQLFKNIAKALPGVGEDETKPDGTNTGGSGKGGDGTLQLATDKKSTAGGTAGDDKVKKGCGCQ